MLGSGAAGWMGSVAGVQLVGLLPKEFELATVYTAAVTAKSQHAQDARDFIALLAGDEAAPVRADCGFA